MAEMRSTVLNGDLLACNAFDEMPRLGEVRVPTMILCGAQDRMTPPRSSEALHSGIQGSELLVIRDAGHMVMLERPAETAHALGSLVSSIEYKPGVVRD